MNSPTAEELRLQTEVEALTRRLNDLAQEAAELRVERDVAWAKVDDLLPRATPEQEAELRKELEQPRHDFSAVMTAVERIGVK